MNRGSFICVLIISLIVLSCKKPINNQSETNSGFNLSSSGAVLSKILPNDTVKVCVKETDSTSTNIVENLAKQSIIAWMEPIGRSPYVKVVDCSQPARITINMNPEEMDSLGMSDPYKGIINYKSGYTQKPIIHSIVLHEMGHVFGLCDQFARTEYCNDPNAHNIEDSSTAVMGHYAVEKTRLTNEDIQKIKALSERSDIPENEKWVKFLNDNTQANFFATTNENTNSISSTNSNPIVDSQTGYLYDDDIEFRVVKNGLDDNNNFHEKFSYFVYTTQKVDKVLVCSGPKVLCVFSKNQTIGFEEQSSPIEGRKLFKNTTKYELKNQETVTVLGFDSSNNIVQAREARLAVH